MRNQTTGLFDNFHASARKSSLRIYCFALLPILAILVLKFFLPELLQNEAGKLVSVRQIIEPKFLSNDWTVASNRGDNVFDSLFALLFAPLWLWLHKIVWVALGARIVCWSVLLASLVKLARTLGIEWYALMCALGIWLMNDQGLAAGEWIFGGSEPKCLAYAFLLMALDAALQRAPIRAGIFCGLTVLAHPLVGMWGSIAVAGAILICWRDYGWKKIARFAAVAVCVGLQNLVVAIHYTHMGTAAENAEVNRIAIFFSDPFHLDPGYFGGWIELLELTLLGAVGVWAFYKILPRAEFKLMGGMLLVLWLEFAAGMIAWQLHLNWFLRSFPFRVADVLVFLFFLLGILTLFARFMLKLAERLRDKTHRSQWANRRPIMLLCLLTVLVLGEFTRECVPLLGHDLPVFVSKWRDYLNGPETPWQEMTRWIRRETPQQAIFAAPPWEYYFWLDAERAQVVSWKRPPHNVGLLEWRRRLNALNGRSFDSRGAEIQNELKENYPALSQQQLQAIHNTFGANYYLTTHERPDLKSFLVHANGTYFLYRLQEE